MSRPASGLQSLKERVRAAAPREGLWLAEDKATIHLVDGAMLVIRYASLTKKYSVAQGGPAVGETKGRNQGG
jgi:hypothetical protein